MQVMPADDDKARRAWHATAFVLASAVCAVAYLATMRLVLGVEVPFALGSVVGVTVVGIVSTVNALLPPRPGIPRRLDRPVASSITGERAAPRR